MQGFFPNSRLLQKRKPLSTIPLCERCGLYKTCESPKMKSTGKGRKRILLVGEAPGKNEDEQNAQFVGKAGRRLRDTLEEAGIVMRRDCWIENAIRCRPPNNRTPTPKEIDYCRPNVINTINEFDPDVIIPLGDKAVKSILGWAWKENPGAVSRWVGMQIPCQKPNVWICPTWHPSYMERLKSDVYDMFFEEHLKRACEIESKPWDSIPDYASRVECLLDDNEATEAIREIIKQGLPCAFDFETNMLKPDSSEAEIVACSISNGKRTISYPWYGHVIEATQKFLLSDIPKDGSNQKFEERWTLKEFGHGVKAWRWDCMLGAHVGDNREGITSIKFQAFVLMGIPSWNYHIEPFLKSKGGSNKPNRIKEIDIKDLTRYCGIDSLVELFVGKQQRKNMNYPE